MHLYVSGKRPMEYGLPVTHPESIWTVFDYYQGPYYQHGLPLSPAWISNHIPNKVWDEIIFRLKNLNGCFPHIIMDGLVTDAGIKVNPC